MPRNPRTRQSTRFVFATDRSGLGCFIGLVLSLVVTASTGRAQGTAEDYRRSDALDEMTRQTVFRDRIRPNWLEDGRSFWYRIANGPETHEFVLVDADRGVREPVFDAPTLAKELTHKTDRDIDPAQLPLRTLTFDDRLNAVRFGFGGRSWSWDRQRGLLSEIEAEGGEVGPEGLPALDRIRPSRNGGGESMLTFRNRLDSEVQLVWIDPSGNRRSYGTLEAGGVREQHTYQFHAWLVLDSEGRPLAAFEAPDGPAETIITSETRPPRPTDSGRRGRGERRENRSPDGRWSARIVEHNLVIRDLESGEEIRLSDDGSSENAYQRPFLWSPDSSKLVVQQVEVGQERTINLIESSPRDQLQPRLITIPYVKPGDRIDHSRPRLFDIASQSALAIDDELFDQPWNLTRFRWRSDSSAFTFLYNQRGHQVLRVIEVDAERGDARALIDERSETFIDYAHKTYLRFLDETNELIWMSERSGWNHLYLLDGETGQVKRPLTEGSWVVRGVERFDPETRRLWLRVGGIDIDQDPYYVHLIRVDLDQPGWTRLTAGDGTHRWEFSPDGSVLIDTYSRVDLPPITELRDAETGELLTELERADWSRLLATGWQPPERFVTKGRDGSTDIYGIIVRPTNFDPERSYPVIENIYAGPQSAYVSKAFLRISQMSRLAELGFIVVQIDGMGTSHRSKAFHDVCWKNLGDSGFPDRIAWLRTAAEAHPEFDLDRVGIYGGSAGGQNALRGLLMHGDFYQVGVADCGCHDNRMDKIWWNELWMGYPIGPHYEEQSNVTQAHRLTGKLLLIVGEVDRNVDPASTLQVVDALIRADKDFDLLLMPGVGHSAAGTPYGSRRLKDFFVRHLHGVEPRRAVPH